MSVTTSFTGRLAESAGWAGESLDAELLVAELLVAELLVADFEEQPTLRKITVINVKKRTMSINLLINMLNRNTGRAQNVEADDDQRIQD